MKSCCIGANTKITSTLISYLLYNAVECSDYFCYHIGYVNNFCLQKEQQGIEEPFFFLVNEWFKTYTDKTQALKVVT